MALAASGHKGYAQESRDELVFSEAGLRQCDSGSGEMVLGFKAACGTSTSEDAVCACMDSSKRILLAPN